MPIYEYHCTACGAEIEALQKFSDPPLVHCENCGAPALEKQLSQSSFSLKGGGWYADGYGGASGKTDAATSSSASDSDKKSADAKSPSESKSDGKKASSTTTSNTKSAESSSTSTSST